MSNTRKLPAKTQAATHATSADEWNQEVLTRIVTLPSGKAVEIKKNVGIMDMANEGLIPNSLMSTVQEMIKKGGKSPGNEEVVKFLGEVDDAIPTMYAMVDAAIVKMVVVPKVKLTPTDDEERLTGPWIYCDQIDETDKMFLFGIFSGGTDDVAQFRKESAAQLAPVLGRKAVGSTTKRRTVSD
jgi:hypothetical protein